MKTTLKEVKSHFEAFKKMYRLPKDIQIGNPANHNGRVCTIYKQYPSSAINSISPYMGYSEMMAYMRGYKMRATNPKFRATNY